YTGHKPSLMRRFLQGAGLLLANLIFFMPRRKVEITVRRVDRSELPGLTREQLNPWLEAWYNEGGPEEPSYVPYHFLFGPRRHEYPTAVAAEEVDLTEVTPQTREAVVRILSERLNRPLSEGEQAPETALDELGLDSIDRMEVTLEVERRFGVTSDETPATVGGLMMMAQGLAAKAPPPRD